MNVTEFADQYKARVTTPLQKKSWSLKKRVQLDTEAVIEGRCGLIVNMMPKELAYCAEQGKERLILQLMATPRNAGMNSKLAHRYRDAKAAGFELKGKAGYESMWYFDPTVPAQAKTALKLVGARYKRTRVLTEEQKTAVAARLAAGRAASRMPVPA